MANGLISFESNGESFSVYMPTNAEPDKVANILRKCESSDAPRTATEFLCTQRETERTHPARLCGSTVVTRSGVDYMYLVNLTTRTATVTKHGHNVYAGSLTNFYSWAIGSNALNALHEAIDKVVRFKYSGGSGTYERLVKLTGVEGDGRNTVLKGWDVKKSTGSKPAYRTYRVANIIGNVEVVG